MSYGDKRVTHVIFIVTQWVNDIKQYKFGYILETRIKTIKKVRKIKYCVTKSIHWTMTCHRLNMRLDASP